MNAKEIIEILKEFSHIHVKTNEYEDVWIMSSSINDETYEKVADAILSKSKEETRERYEMAIDESYAYLIENEFMPAISSVQVGIQEALRIAARLGAFGKEG